MAIETEKKYRLDEVRARSVEEELAEAGAVYAGEDLEENTIYGGGILDETLSVLRIRTTQKGATLTFKRRIANDLAVKKQLEYESEFANVEELREIIKNLGFTPRIVYEKRRKKWHLPDAEVVIDLLPFGMFMEIEGTVTAIRKAEIILGLEDLEAEHETYPRLTVQFGKNAGGVAEARFEVPASPGPPAPEAR